MKQLFRPFPVPLTRRQWFYLLVIQGLGAGFIDGGANFAVAYAMYNKQTDVRMWVFKKNTIAGDLGVTPIIQCLASMLITSTLVHTDLHHHAIAPLPFVYPHVEHLPDPRTLFKPRGKSADEKEEVEEGDERSKFGYYWWMLIRFIFEGTERNMMVARVSPREWFKRLIWTVAQGAAIGVILGFPIWCLAIIILGPIYGTGNMGNKWAPQVIKCIYGAVVGWVTNPVIATLALGSQAPNHLVVIEHDVEEEIGVPTIPEDEVLGSPSIGRTIAVGQSSPILRRGSDVLPNTPRSINRTRSRTGSIASRPPLTTNVSHLSPLPSPNPMRLRGNSYSARPRGQTISSEHSARSYSYALGGTGGRAQRSNSRSSTNGGLPTLIFPQPESERQNIGLNLTLSKNVRDDSAMTGDVFGRDQTIPSLGLPGGTRRRAQTAASIMERPSVEEREARGDTNANDT